MKKASPVFVGVDVGKKQLDVHFYPAGEAAVFVNDENGLKDLVALLLLRRPKRVVFESTGGYARRMQRALQDAGVAAHCVPAQRIRMFAKALGIEAKTDIIDAAVIALYAATAKLADIAAPSATVLKLRGLAARRVQLVALATKEKIYRESMPDDMLAVSDEILRLLKKQVVALDQAMVNVIASDAELAKRAEALVSIGGIGPVVSAAMLAFLPELGQASAKQLSSLVGVAPFNSDSADTQGRRSIRGGRRRLRHLLYMAARAAVRSEPRLKALYLRLKQIGKPDKVAIVAVMRKLVVIANARVRDAIRPQVVATVGVAP